MNILSAQRSATTPIIRPTDTVGGLDHKTKGITGERDGV
jgi:hypothetical protein